MKGRRRTLRPMVLLAHFWLGLLMLGMLAALVWVTIGNPLGILFLLAVLTAGCATGLAAYILIDWWEDL